MKEGDDKGHIGELIEQLRRAARRRRNSTDKPAWWRESTEPGCVQAQV